MKGGKSSGRTTTSSPTPFLQNGYTDGASSSREQAAANTSNMNAKQSAMFSKSGGNRKKSKKGGKSTGRSTTSSSDNTVPQFSSGVGAGPVNANTSSVQNNQTSTQTIADAAGDCWATNSCSGGGKESFQNWYEAYHSPAGGKRKPRTRRRKNKRKTKGKRRASKKQTNKRGNKKRRNNKKKTRSTGRRQR